MDIKWRNRFLITWSSLLIVMACFPGLLMATLRRQWMEMVLYERSTSALLIFALVLIGFLLFFTQLFASVHFFTDLWKVRLEVIPTAAAEVFGTGVIGGLLAYPIAVAFMGVSAANVAFYAYIVPFLISTVVGSVIAAVLVLALMRAGALSDIMARLER